MSTLADSFLDDLDDLEGDSDDEEVEDGAVAGGEGAGGEGGGGDAMDAEDGDGDGEVDLDDMLGDMKAGGDVSSVATLRKSEHFLEHMRKVDESMAREARPMKSGNVEQDPEYQLVVSSNDLIVKIDDEMVNVHKYVVDLYSKKFPELESLVPSRLDYLRVVEVIGNEMDMTMVDLSAILPNALVISVSMTGSTTSGQPLSEADLQQCQEGVAEALALEEARNATLQFVETRMNSVAPNLCAIIDTVIAAQLMGLAGGLGAMAKTPACNFQVMGQQKGALAGFSAAASMPHTGILFFATVVQQAPPYLRAKALKVTAAKVALAARIDLYQTDPSGDGGRRMRGEIDDKIEKWQEPQQARIKKALPVPDDKPHKKRGGKRARRTKEKFGMTDMRKDANRRTFADMEGEYGDDAMGHDLGMIGKSAGKLRAPVKKEQKLAAKKLKLAAAKQMSSGATNGLSSSLVFTPVQGLELANPNANEMKVREANQKWFSQSSGFMSAMPK